MSTSHYPNFLFGLNNLVDSICFTDTLLYPVVSCCIGYATGGGQGASRSFIIHIDFCRQILLTVIFNLTGDATPYTGYSIDLVYSYDIVLYDGKNVTASATENSDLYWYLRGKC